MRFLLEKEIEREVWEHVRTYAVRSCARRVIREGRGELKPGMRFRVTDRLTDEKRYY